MANDSEHFNALAAAAETSELDVLPSLILVEDDEPEPETDLLTAQDLAHFTGDTGPAVHGWESSTPTASAPTTTDDGIDAPVSKAVVLPLVVVALIAVGFVAYSIITAASPARPDNIALVDTPTTTAISTTTTEPLDDGPGAIGVDLAEQAEWLCAGDQFGIARAQAPSLAIYNDLLTVTRDGRADWNAPADDETLRGPVPSLIGCLTTADGGEIARCPSNGSIISQRSVNWSYRVLRSLDGVELGADNGTATDQRPCEDLETEASGQDFASWSPLPQVRLDEVAAAYTSAPHPQTACAADTTTVDPTQSWTTPTDGLSLHATFDGITETDVALPAGWMATEERPVEAVLCLQIDEGSGASDNPAPLNPPASSIERECEVSVQVTAMLRNGPVIGSWTYFPEICVATDDTIAVPAEWWTDVVGPALGYSLPSEGE